MAGVMALALPAMAGGVGGTAPLPTTPPAPPPPANVVQLLGLTNADTGTPPPPPATPTDDLRNLMDALHRATTAAAASAARQGALDILEGNPIAGRTYSGIPLLGWNVPAKVKNVPAGGSVTVTEVRFDDQVLTDTALLTFADPSQPFSVTYRVADLTQSTGDLTPTALQSASGSQLASDGLTLPNMPTGTTVINNFHPEGQPEQTREGVEVFTVKMPAPNTVSAFLDPNIVHGHQGMATLVPASAAVVSAVTSRFGTQKAAAIAKIGAQAPEKLLWNDLTALDPTNLAAANALGAQDAVLVAAIRNHEQIPAGVATDPATVAVVLLNGHAYVSQRMVNLAPGAAMSVSVKNADGYDHTFSAAGLSNRKATFNALDWGQFNATGLVPAMTLAPGASQTFTVTPASNAFALVLGDTMNGEQGSTFLTLNRGPVEKSLVLSPSTPATQNFTAPSAGALDKSGNLWLPLEGSDTIAKIDTGTLAQTNFPLPGGFHNLTDTVANLAPHDLTFDQSGIAWVTLMLGNSVARFDPATGTVTEIPLAPCTDNCAAFNGFPRPVHAGPDSRQPQSIVTTSDAAGNTVVVFTEHGADALGVMEVSPAGSVLGKSDISCGCSGPAGIARAGDGTVWFVAEGSNELVHAVINPADPVHSVVAEHFALPSTVASVDPSHDVSTSLPRGIVVDGAGRVWVSETDSGKIAFLDAAHSTITELSVPATAFGVAAHPAGLAVDSHGTVFFVDRQGDMVGTVSTSGVGSTFRPEHRVSVLSGPVFDASGNLWVSEVMAGRVTRFSAPGTGTPAPSSAKPVVVPAAPKGSAPATPAPPAAPATSANHGNAVVPAARPAAAATASSTGASSRAVTRPAPSARATVRSSALRPSTHTAVNPAPARASLAAPAPSATSASSSRPAGATVTNALAPASSTKGDLKASRASVTKAASPAWHRVLFSVIALAAIAGLARIVFGGPKRRPTA